jgi:ubiquinone/menaquinone biosynthesis C-methylase UbiE
MKSGPKLYKTKEISVLPRITKTIGILKSFYPNTLLDVGTGRGVFIFELIKQLPHIDITCIDKSYYRTTQLQLNNIKAFQKNVLNIDFNDNQFDITACLEVLEHIDDYKKAFDEVMRVSKIGAIFSVPSKQDDNPGHINLIKEDDFKQLGSNYKVKFEYVPNHRIILVLK